MEDKTLGKIFTWPLFFAWLQVNYTAKLAA
jgi:hypothetical protein